MSTIKGRPGWICEINSSKKFWKNRRKCPKTCLNGFWIHRTWGGGENWEIPEMALLGTEMALLGDLGDFGDFGDLGGFLGFLAKTMG